MSRSGSATRSDGEKRQSHADVAGIQTEADGRSRSVVSAAHSQRRRRSNDPGRRRDPERTRLLILNAASEEFARFGYDDARIVRIAERAGVAHQLITYHFGGKKGLFDALGDRWLNARKDLAEAAAPFTEVVPALIQLAREDAFWEQALIRDGQQGQDHAQLVERLAPILDNARRRQQLGEIAPELDPGIVALLFLAANWAPVVLPHITRALCAVDPADPTFDAYYAEQLSRVFKYLARPQEGSSHGS